MSTTTVWAVPRDGKWQLIQGVHDDNRYAEQLIREPMSAEDALAWLRRVTRLTGWTPADREW